MIVLINPFEVPQGITDEAFLAGWEQAADYLRTRPGFIDARLHRAVSPDPRFRFINVAQWESPEAFRAAVTTDAFRTLAGNTPTNHPALYQVVRTVGAQVADARIEEGALT